MLVEPFGVPASPHPAPRCFGRPGLAASVERDDAPRAARRRVIVGAAGQRAGATAARVAASARSLQTASKETVKTRATPSEEWGQLGVVLASALVRVPVRGFSL